MLDWLKAAGIFVALWIAFELAHLLLTPAIRPVGRALNRLYTPPHGGWVLFATWVGAFAGLWIGWNADSDQPILGIASMIVAPVIAMFATLVYRDQRRARRGLPAVVTEVPETLGYSRASCSARDRWSRWEPA